MCLGFPGKILSIDAHNVAQLDIGGTRREACLDIVDDEVAVGDYVICHAGYAIHRVDEAVARDKLEMLQEIIEKEIF